MERGKVLKRYCGWQNEATLLVQTSWSNLRSRRWRLSLSLPILSLMSIRVGMFFLTAVFFWTFTACTHGAQARLELDYKGSHDSGGKCNRTLLGATAAGFSSVSISGSLIESYGWSSSSLSIEVFFILIQNLRIFGALFVCFLFLLKTKIDQNTQKRTFCRWTPCYRNKIFDSCTR